MRDPNRLYGFYAEFANLHAKYFPDWRTGQLLTNFHSWLFSVKGVNPFFPEENKYLTYFKEFCGEKVDG